jgi:hypothetical protein
MLEPTNHPISDQTRESHAYRLGQAAAIIRALVDPASEWDFDWAKKAGREFLAKEDALDAKASARLQRLLAAARGVEEVGL